MIRTLDFNPFAAGTIIDDDYAGVTIAATGGSGKAMIFDSANPTGDDADLASETLRGLLIISQDGNSDDPDDNATGGTLVFDFANEVRMKSITFKDIEETAGPGTVINFYDADGALITSQFVEPTGDGGEATVSLDVPGTARFEVVLQGSGAIDNLVFDDPAFVGDDSGESDGVTPDDSDGVVSNDDEDALIDTAYTGDPDGDRIDNGDAVLPGEGAEDDIVDAQGGNDTVLSGAGNDDVYAGAGDDSVEGGAGDDVIFGDSQLGSDGDKIRESFEWDQAGVEDRGDLSGGFTQDTGSVNVTYAQTFQAAGSTTEYSDDLGNVEGIPTDGSAADATSSLDSTMNGENNCGVYELSFSDAVCNADFRINDIDGDGFVRVLAYDAEGNQTVVTLSGGDNLVLWDSDDFAGNDSAEGTGGYQDDNSADHSLLVSIPGPVSRIVIEHTQNGPDNSGVNITDVYFDAPAGAVVAGDDDLDGQEGDDAIFGEGGDDTLSGGAGADTLSGGDDADLIVGGDAGDAVDGGAGGDDNDTLDLRDSGPLRVVNQTLDADGNSTSGTVEFLDGDGEVTGTMTFAEIENLLLPEANSTPIANDDSDTTDEDTAITVDLLANDSDPDGDALEVKDATVPAAQGTLVDNGDGTVTFTPAPDFNGEATISYTICDPSGAEATASHVITVTPVNDAPVAVDDTDTTEENTAVTIDLLANDTDPDGDVLSVKDVSVPAEQGSIVDNGDGTATFTPAIDFVGEATVSYIICDPDGLEDSATHVVTVLEANGSPVAVDDTAETDEDTAVTIDLLGNDTDPDGDVLALKDATVPAEQGTLVDNGDGTVTFTPAADFNGEATISYTICDPDGSEDTGEAVVTVNPVNDAPVAVDDAATTPFNESVTIDLIGNDTDPDGDVLELKDATVPAEQGTLVDNGDGTVTFTPAAGFDGEATITYTICDPNGLEDTGIAIVLVRDGIVEGTDGDDLIDTDYEGDPEGDVIDGDDAILPGTSGNDDSVVAGDGDDTVIAGQGSDTVEGGEGNDVIDTSNGDLAPDLGYPTAPTDPLGYDPDADPEDDRDSVDGGAGDDTITTGDDRDTITGGTGADVINAGIDDDIVDGGADDDRIVGGEGNDLIEGGSGNDTIYAGNDPDLGLDVLDITDEDTGGISPDRNPGNGQDTVFGGAGDDVIFGADDDDVLDGGTGDDLLDGQIDDDTLTGGAGEDTLLGGQGDDSLAGGTGNDTLDGGIGDDTMAGGDDRDIFVNVNAGDVVDGGTGGDDFDTLDLTGSAPEGGSFSIEYTSEDREDGVVSYFDADGNDAGQLVFEEIENVIPCFTPGTKIATPKGEVPVENLKVGDRVITRDNGIREIRWVGARDMSGAELERAAHLRPVLIRQGALGNDLPERDMMVSPNHRVLVANDKAALYFEEREVLVAAKHLIGELGIDIVEVSHTTYIHVMFDQHEVILSDGCWSESFQPGDQSLAGIGDAQRNEILELFPELASRKGVDAYASARRSLKKHEAKLIL